MTRPPSAISCAPRRGGCRRSPPRSASSERLPALLPYAIALGLVEPWAEARERTGAPGPRGYRALDPQAGGWARGLHLMASLLGLRAVGPRPIEPPMPARLYGG